MSKKRKRTILLAALLAVLLFAGVWLSGVGREIGFISAREGYVELYDGRIYGPCEDDFRAADRGRLLGRLDGGEWLVFDVRGGDGEYIYIASMGRGEFLRLTEGDTTSNNEIL